MNYSAHTAPQTLTQLVTVELIDAAGTSTLPSELRYSTADPYAVTISFVVGKGEVGWTFGRDLLFDGLYEPTGLGDVHLRPCLDAHGHAVVVIELQSPEGLALIEARACDLQRFVDRMTSLVRHGDESQYLDIDATVAAILVANPID